MHRFRQMKIWQRSISLAEEIYKITNSFPDNEKFGLVSQLRRCAISIASNIAEGAGRESDKQFRYFLQVSMGSCNELQTQLELSRRFNFIESELADRVQEETLSIYRMMLSFYRTLKE